MICSILPSCPSQSINNRRLLKKEKKRTRRWCFYAFGERRQNKTPDTATAATVEREIAQ